MTKSGEHSRYKIWLQQGYYDIQAAKHSFENQSYEWTCYQSVQATEKILKAVLVHAGWSPPKTHKLGVLVSLCNRANKVFLNVKLNFRKLEAYTFISRYPFVYPDQKQITPHEYINKNDGEVCLAIAKEVFSKVQGFLSEKIDYPTEIINIEDFYFTAQEVETRLKEVVDEITQGKEIQASKIILFGTFAREKNRPKTSTLDLIVVGETNLNFIERIENIRELTKGGEPIVEPLVYTAEEFNYMLNDNAEGFLESAIREGKVIWEKKAYQGGLYTKF